LWTARMREEYPPRGNINGRFGPTTRIRYNRLEILDLDRSNGTAVVAVDLVEDRTDGTQRRYIGTWDLVLTGRGWLMDDPHFQGG
ncbi:MAG: hypothetical protein WKF56_06150, partial [Candidatus Limnocylindrales bacterium]